MLAPHTMPSQFYLWPPGGTSCLWGQRAPMSQPPSPKSQLHGLAAGSQHKTVVSHPGNFLEKASGTWVTGRVDKGGCAGAGWTTLKCRICLRGANMQKKQGLGGMKTSKPWQRDADINASVMTAWGRRKVFPCTSCTSWRGGVDGCDFFFFPFYMYSEAVLKELLVENFLHWKLSSLSSRNEFA